MEKDIEERRLGGFGTKETQDKQTGTGQTKQKSGGHFFKNRSKGTKLHVWDKIEKKNKGIWHEIIMNETKKNVFGHRDTRDKKMTAHSGTNQYSRYFNNAVGWRLTDLDPSRAFPLLCQTPNSTRWSGARRPSSGKRPSADIRPLVDIRRGFRSLGFVFGSMVFFLSRLPFRFCPLLSFPVFACSCCPKCLFLSHVNVFLSRLCFFVPLTFADSETRRRWNEVAACASHVRESPIPMAMTRK